MRRAAAAVLSLGFLVLAGCAAPTSFQGIPFAAGAADPELAGLAMRASSGDRHALLELGIRFEEGRGVPVDLRRAARLYRRAAATTGGSTMIYVPPTRRGGSGYVMPVNLGPVVPGLPEARERLQALRKRRAAKGDRRRI
jgi:hypothetical protein